MTDANTGKPTPYQLEYGDHIPQGVDSARRNLIRQGQFVLFTDILGFADLVEQNEELYVEWAVTLSSLYASMRRPPASPLEHLFERFHRVIEAALANAGHQRPPAIVFSDSAFFASNRLASVLDIARMLMRELLLEGVPVRMGLGFGGFDAARFSTETTHFRTHHVSQFYGTAVVRAHRAESCGVAGMRILLHPSAYERIAESRTVPKPTFVIDDPVPSWFTLPLPAPSPRHAVSQELNYLTASSSDDRMRQSVWNMKGRAPVTCHHHYDETLAAIQRMREAMR